MVSGRSLCLLLVVCFCNSNQGIIANSDVPAQPLEQASPAGTGHCGAYDFACEDGTCIDEGLWCDSEPDCPDKSDEAFCKRANSKDSDPNRCPKNYFKCRNGPCIPLAGRCNEYPNCDDNSDEEHCNGTQSAKEAPTRSTIESTHAATTTLAPTITSQSEILPEEVSTLEYTRSREYTDNFVRFEVSDFGPQRDRGRKWLLSQRKDYEWAEDTPRAVIALQLSRVAPFADQNEDDMLMTKQLEIRLSIALTRNQSKEIPLTDLALYINALSASCKNPKNFHGYDLVRTLRQRVDAAQEDSFVSPLVYLTLCNHNETAYDDYKRAQVKLFIRKMDKERVDLQALMLLMSSCILKVPAYARSEASRLLATTLLNKIDKDGLPGNVYEMALLVQALNHAKVGGWDMFKALDFILKQQQNSGSFGDILAAYYVLPILSGRSLFALSEHCGSSHDKTGLTPIEVLKNTKRSRIYVNYGLYYGDPVEVSQMLKIQVAQGSTFLDIMRLAQDIDPKYRFLMDNDKEVPLVYSIGGNPNDAEKGLYWMMHVAEKTNESSSKLVPFKGSVKKLIPNPGDEVVFWRKPIA